MLSKLKARSSSYFVKSFISAQKVFAENNYRKIYIDKVLKYQKEVKLFLSILSQGTKNLNAAKKNKTNYEDDFEVFCSRSCSPLF